MLFRSILNHSEGNECSYVREFLSALRALPSPPAMGLLTGNVRLGAEIKLRHYRLWEEFCTGGFGDDHENRGEIAKVARARGSKLVGRPLAGEEILVIGDTPLDIACAKAIDARCLAVATGHAPVAELKSHGPTWAVRDLSCADPRELCR